MSSNEKSRILTPGAGKFALITNDKGYDYHGDVSRIGSSMLKMMADPDKTPAHVYEQYFNPERDQSVNKSAFAFGSMFHASILEQHDFDNHYVIVPEGLDRRSTDGKSLFADIAASGKTAIKHKEFEAAKKMVASLLKIKFIKNNPINSALMEAAIIGYKFKCKPDLLYLNDSDIVRCADLKTCVDASPAGFSKAAFRMGYHIQAAWYTDIIKLYTGRDVEFIFVCIEKAAPHCCAVYYASDAMLEAGRKAYREAYDRLAWCIETNQWPGYSQDTQELDLPDWAYPDESDEIEI